jgi:predicted signal transduction protein with EAL and GGDEF domain
VTETAVFNGGPALDALNEVHRLGVRIALDDFGTGHSSLRLLQTVPVDILKVDKSFVDSIALAGRHAVIARALIDVSNGLNLVAVAEGVETAEQAAELYRLGYRYVQGYYFGRPAAEPDFRGAGRALRSRLGGLSVGHGALRAAATVTAFVDAVVPRRILVSAVRALVALAAVGALAAAAAAIPVRSAASRRRAPRPTTSSRGPTARR